jgi:hypothetical protein
MLNSIHGDTIYQLDQIGVIHGDPLNFPNMGLFTKTMIQALKSLEYSWNVDNDIFLFPWRLETLNV